MTGSENPPLAAEEAPVPGPAAIADEDPKPLASPEVRVNIPSSGERRSDATSSTAVLRWGAAIERLRTDPQARRLSLGAAVAVAILVVVVPILVEIATVTPLSHIRNNPTKLDGRTVKVKGLVGEVFRVGSGYAFYLHQSRDSIVVFTRSRVPVPRQRLGVHGRVSIGFLEGVPRSALFEQPR